MISAIVAMSLANASLVDVVAPGRFLGRWNNLGAWVTEEREIGPGRKVCITYSQRQDQFLTTVYFMFGIRNEIGFLTKTPIKRSSRVKLEWGKNSWRSISSISQTRVKGELVGSDSLHRDMESSERMGALIQNLRHAKAVSLVIDGTKHAIPMEQFAKAYEQMQACERHRLNMVLRD